MTDVVVVELEGVVFETRDARLASLREALVTQAIDSAFDADSVLGLPPRAAAKVALAAAEMPADDVLIDLVALSAERAFASRIALGAVSLQRGAHEFLEQASVARLGAVTRTSRSDVETLLRLSGLDHAFAIVVSADDVLDPKPSPEGYLLALQRLARLRPVNLGAVLALEDSASGIAAARASGLRCVAVGRVPPHVAMEANAFVGSLEGQSLGALELLTRPRQERV